MDGETDSDHMDRRGARRTGFMPVEDFTHTVATSGS